MRGKTELMVQLSYDCNLNCVHCSYGDMQGSPILTEEQITVFLEKHDPKLIKISGGEPTICDVFEDAVGLCKETGAKVVAFTNGLGVSKRHPDYYWVSLFGESDVHNAITRADTFDGVMNFIESHSVEYLSSPVFSENQMRSLMRVSDRLGIPLRITQLLPHGTPHTTLGPETQRAIVRDIGLDREPNWVTCSLGFDDARCSQKACLKPDGREIVCTALIRGLKCLYMGVG